MTVQVGQLRLRLPAGLESRAESIARDVAQGIAQLRPTRTVTLNVLTLEPVQIEDGMSDAQAADAIVRQLAALLGAER